MGLRIASTISTPCIVDDEKVIGGRESREKPTAHLRLSCDTPLMKGIGQRPEKGKKEKTPKSC